MGWRTKSAQFKFISLPPKGTALYNHTQEKLMKSTMASSTRLNQKMTELQWHGGRAARKQGGGRPDSQPNH